jgi:hypothetical protein
MKPSRSRALLVAAVLLLMAFAAGLFLTRAGRHGRAVPQAAVDRATQALIAQQETLDPILAIILDSVRRRFDLAAVPSQTPYVDAAQQAARNAGTVMRTGDRQADMLAIFRRLMDPSATATADEIEALRMPIDQVTATALHCQTVRVPADLLMTLDEMVQIGGYAMTHAIIASQWLIENGCVPAATIAERRQRYVDALVRQIEKDEGHITDRRVEALATLFYMGGGEHARQEWVDFVVQRQLPDGQWSGYADQPQTPNAHTTLMALWLLLEARSEGQPSLAPMVAQRAPQTAVN